MGQTTSPPPPTRTPFPSRVRQSAGVSAALLIVGLWLPTAGLSAPAERATPPDARSVERLAPGAPPAPVEPIRLIGTAVIDAQTLDRSGLTDMLGPTPHARFGGWGSAMAQTAEPGVYLVLSDRGPRDGAADYLCRWHRVRVEVEPGSASPVRFELLETVMMRDGRRALIGAERALPGDDPGAPWRFDPEGVRVMPDGEVLVSDEYGPWVFRFDAQGRKTGELPVPAKFRVPSPRPEAEQELRENTRGRVPNRGLEGLAITPDAAHAVAILQSPLIQDGGREGENVRLIVWDLKTGATREHVYVLDSPSLGLNEILAISATQFLVIERDGREGRRARVKKITRIDLDGASDVSAIDALPKQGLPEGVRPVRKSDFLDLLHPDFGLAGDHFPAKVEALCWGPDLPDGSRLLLVASDNDFKDDEPSFIWAFSIPAAVLPGFQHQLFGAQRPSATSTR
jgi:hypothetical protein